MLYRLKYRKSAQVGIWDFKIKNNTSTLLHLNDLNGHKITNEHCLTLDSNFYLRFRHYKLSLYVFFYVPFLFDSSFVTCDVRQLGKSGVVCVCNTAETSWRFVIIYTWFPGTDAPLRLLRLYNLLLVHMFGTVWEFSHILPGASLMYYLRMPAPI